jgi:hypothetical protein
VEWTRSDLWSLRRDAGAEYYMLKRFAPFGSLRNVTDAPQDAEIHGSLTPEPAHFRSRNEYPALGTFGGKSTF